MINLLLKDLRPGMVTAQSICNQNGDVVLKRGEPLTDANIDKLVEIGRNKRSRFAEPLLIGAEVIVRDFLRVPFLRASAGKEQHIRLDALRVENPGGQAEDGVQIAEVHQLPAHAGAIAACKQYVIWHDDRATGFPIRFQTAVNDLKEVQLFVREPLNKSPYGRQDTDLAFDF